MLPWLPSMFVGKPIIVGHLWVTISTEHWRYCNNILSLMSFNILCVVQDTHVTTLCQSMVTIANTRCPALLHQAEFLQLTFTKAFNNFAKCRSIYDSGKALSDDNISELGMYSTFNNRKRKYHCMLSSFTQRSRSTSSWSCTGTPFLLPLSPQSCT